MGRRAKSVVCGVWSIFYPSYTGTSDVGDTSELAVLGAGLPLVCEPLAYAGSHLRTSTHRPALFEAFRLPSHHSSIPTNTTRILYLPPATVTGHRSTTNHQPLPTTRYPLTANRFSLPATLRPPSTAHHTPHTTRRMHLTTSHTCHSTRHTRHSATRRPLPTTPHSPPATCHSPLYSCYRWPHPTR